MKQQEVFITLVNKQLEPFGKTYEDVHGQSNWYTKYVTTEENESIFMNWGVNYLSEALGLTKKQAETEMNWFILQWGLKTNKIVNSTISVEDMVQSLKKSK